MKLLKHQASLREYNTFHVPALCHQLMVSEDEKEIKDTLLKLKKDGTQRLILGGGSNVLFLDDFEGSVIKPDIQGIDIIRKTRDHAYLRVGAGMEWDDLVNWTVEEGMGGLENLSLIPGKVGSSPIQNIGAYGAELKDVMEEVTFFHIEEAKYYTLKSTQCRFGYRDSIFKNELKEDAWITHVTFRLSLNPEPNLSYTALKETLQKADEITIKSVRNAVIQIRKAKLPDPAIIGNAGSFFKNPVVDRSTVIQLHQHHPDLPAFEQGDGTYKLSAAWLIDQCGWKGYREGDAGVHHKQPLVLVNYGNATGKEILTLAMKIKDSVNARFGVTLSPEVNIIR